jgi:hypothetical protein
VSVVDGFVAVKGELQVDGTGELQNLIEVVDVDGILFFVLSR